MNINGTEYNLPDHIERYIVQIAEQIKADGEKAADALIAYNRTEGEILYRRSGRTTKIIDRAIQTLFTKGEVTVYDHYNTEKSRSRVAWLIDRMLDMEHRGQYEFNKREMKFTLLGKKRAVVPEPPAPTVPHTPTT